MQNDLYKTLQHRHVRMSAFWDRLVNIDAYKVVLSGPGLFIGECAPKVLFILWAVKWMPQLIDCNCESRVNVILHFWLLPIQKWIFKRKFKLTFVYSLITDNRLGMNSTLTARKATRYCCWKVTAEFREDLLKQIEYLRSVYN